MHPATARSKCIASNALLRALLVVVCTGIASQQVIARESCNNALGAVVEAVVAEESTGGSIGWKLLSRRGTPRVAREPAKLLAQKSQSGSKTSSKTQGTTSNTKRNKQGTPATPQSGAKTEKLYGRIDQLFNSAGASMPKGVFKMETPKYDFTPPTAPTQQSNTSEPKPLTGYVTNSFPVNWKGTWSGNVTVVKFADNPICWRGDALEMYGIRRISKPGRQGRITCTFKSDDGVRMTLDPPTIIMNVNMQRPSFTDIISSIPSTQVIDPSLQGMDVDTTLRGDMKIPLGSAVSYKNVNGNPVSMSVLKNELRELDNNTMEQDVLVQMDEYNKLMARVSNSFNESVLRFSADGDELDLEIAQVSYDASGAFLSKTIYSGTLTKSR